MILGLKLLGVLILFGFIGAVILLLAASFIMLVTNYYKGK